MSHLDILSTQGRGSCLFSKRSGRARSTSWSLRYPASLWRRHLLRHARSRSLRILVSIAAKFNLPMKQYDMANAFTNSEVDEELWAHCPAGY